MRPKVGHTSGYVYTWVLISLEATGSHGKGVMNKGKSLRFSRGQGSGI